MTTLSEIINLHLRQAGLEANISAIYGNIIAKYRSDITVYITGVQGPTGKSTLCKELKKLGVNAFEAWELEDKSLSDINTSHIDISLNKPLRLCPLPQNLKNRR